MPDPKGGGRTTAGTDQAARNAKTAAVGNFLENYEKARDIEQLKNMFAEALVTFNCPWFNCFSLTSIDRPPSNAIRILKYPKHWVERYIANSYFQIDPVLTESLITHMPIIWDEELKNEKYTAEQLALFDEAAKAGLKHFLTIPVHKPGSLPAVVTIVSERPFTDKLDTHLLQLISICLHDKAHRIIHNVEKPHRQKYILTPREQDCIIWSAYGKTDHQIADILKISHNTAHRHLENAKRKLGAFNRAHAVSIAIRLREIIL